MCNKDQLLLWSYVHKLRVSGSRNDRCPGIGLVFIGLTSLNVFLRGLNLNELEANNLIVPKTLSR